MRKVREILRLRWDVGLSQRETARSLSISPSAVCECVRRAREAGLSWPACSELGDVELEACLYRKVSPPVPKAVPDWARVHRELRRKGVTLQLLWQEYREVHATDGYSYSQYCDLYRRYRGKLDVVLRHEHRAGEKLFVDYAGHGIPIVDPRTGEVTRAEMFVAVLGASSYTYAEATPSQRLPDWIQSHQRAFEFFGGVTEVTVPDQPSLDRGFERAGRCPTASLAASCALTEGRWTWGGTRARRYTWSKGRGARWRRSSRCSSGRLSEMATRPSRGG